MHKVGKTQVIKKIQYFTMFLLLLIISSYAFSVVEVKAFSSDELRDRFQVLVNELRCPKCQNQNLADSNSPIAADLRKEIFRMLEEGRSDQEIVDFLVARYGEFVMYRPPVKKTTLMLWLTPVFLFVIGIFIVLFIRRRQSADAMATTVLGVEELQRLEKLLGEQPQKNVSTQESEEKVVKDTK
jgi:cytochrome c-type biogenesis protein CcmH